MSIGGDADTARSGISNSCWFPASALQTRTDFGKPGYGGPCPPQNDHPHRYIDALVPNCELQSDGQNRFLTHANWRYFLRSAAYPFRSSSKVGSNPGHATISNCYSKRRLEQRLNVGGRRYSAWEFRFSRCFQQPFRHFAAFWAIEITTEFLFVGMAKVTLAVQQAFPSSPHSNASYGSNPSTSYTGPNLRYSAILCDAAVDRFGMTSHWSLTLRRRSARTG